MRQRGRDVAAVLLLVRIDSHRAELQDRERLHVTPEPPLPEQHRPGRVETDRDGDRRHHGCQENDHHERYDVVEAALQEPGRWRQPARRQTDDGETLEGVNAGLGADDLEQARHDVDLHVELPQLADRVEQLVVARVGERDDHALDVEQRDDLRQAVGLSDERQVLELGPPCPWVRVDEADEVDAVLRVLEELPSRELADVAGTEDDRVLKVERTASRDRARDPAR